MPFLDDLNTPKRGEGCLMSDLAASTVDDAYTGLSVGVAAEARAVADRIRTRMRSCIIETGGELHRMKGLLGHGNFRRWHEAELGVDARTCQNYMSAHRAFAGKSEIVAHLNATTLIRLAAKSVSQDLRDAITARFTDNQRMTDAEVLRAIQDAKAIPAPTTVEDDADDEAETSTADTEITEDAPDEPGDDDVEDAFTYVFGDDPPSVATPHEIDLARFAKVRAMHDGATTVGEKAAAAGRMQAIASAAGLTVEDAVSKLDALQTTKPRSFFDHLFDHPEFRAAHAEGERKRAERRAAILAEYESEDAVFEDSPIEAALRRACEPLLGPGETWRTIYHLDRWNTVDELNAMPTSVRHAVTGAWPMPATVREAWVEFQTTDKLIGDRCGIDYTHVPHVFVEARQHVLESMLDTLPARSVGDLDARVAWMRHWVEHECQPDQAADRVRIATLADDIKRFGEMVRSLRDTGAGLPGAGVDEADEPDPFSPECWPESQDSRSVH